MEFLSRREAIKKSLTCTIGLTGLLSGCSLWRSRTSQVKYKIVPTGLEGKERFLLGVNYWPREKAMYWWKDFDEEEVRKEFGQIKEELNLDLVRIFLLWEDFQPKPPPSRINKDSLNNLETVLETADNLDLKVIVTFFTGHMSGVNWAPEWGLEGIRLGHPFRTISNGEETSKGIKNIYTDELMLEAELFQLEEIISKVKHHRSVYAWDLGNENSIFSLPRSYSSSRRWIKLMHDKIKDIDKVHPVTLGTYMAALSGYNGFRIDDLAAANDFLSMHAYPGYTGLARGKQDSDFVPFCNVLTRSIGKKPVLFEEFGVPTKTSSVKLVDKSEKKLIKEEDAAQYYHEVLEKLHKAGSLGAVAWCYSDYDSKIWNKPPLDEVQHERFFGLTRADGSIKPHGQVMRDFASRNLKVKPALVISNLPEPYYGVYGLKAKCNFKNLYETFIGRWFGF